MARTTKAATATATALDRIFDNARNEGTARADIVALLKACAKGADQATRIKSLIGHREQYIAGRMSVTLFAKMNNIESAKAAALAAMALPHAKATAKDKRNAAQEAAYNAAKMSWSRLLSEAGVVTPTPRAKPAAPKADKSQGVVDTAPAPIPTIANVADWKAELKAELDRFTAILRKNAGNMTVAQRKPFQAFIDKATIELAEPKAK